MARYIKINTPNEVKTKAFQKKVGKLLAENSYNDLILSYDFVAHEDVLNEMYNTFRVMVNKILFELDKKS